MEYFESDKFREILRIVGGRIWKKFSPWFRRLDWSHGYAQSWIEQVCVDGLLYVRKNQDKWDPEKADFPYWCYLKTKAIARDRLLYADRRKDLLKDISETQPVSTDDPINALLSKAVIKDIFDAVTPDQKEALSLFYLYGLKVREVSRIMRCPEKTVHTHLDRGRKKARQYLEKVRASEDALEKSKTRRNPDLSAQDQKERKGSCETRPPPQQDAN